MKTSRYKVPQNKQGDSRKLINSINCLYNRELMTAEYPRVNDKQTTSFQDKPQGSFCHPYVFGHATDDFKCIP